MKVKANFQILDADHWEATLDGSTPACRNLKRPTFFERSKTIYFAGEQIFVVSRHVDGKRFRESIQDRLDMIQWTWESMIQLQVIMDHTIAIVSGLGVLREVRECETCAWSYPVKNPRHVFFSWRRPPKLQQEPGKKQHTAKWKIIHDS